MFMPQKAAFCQPRDEKCGLGSSANWILDANFIFPASFIFQESEIMIRLRCLVTLFALLSAPGAFAQRPGVDQLKNQAMEGIEARRKLAQEITDLLFSFSELGYQEYESSKYLTGILKPSSPSGARASRSSASCPISTGCRKPPRNPAWPITRH
jgi:hypothetical protein